jgi:hypothetical protein
MLFKYNFWMISMGRFELENNCFRTNVVNSFDAFLVLIVVHFKVVDGNYLVKTIEVIPFRKICK